ncbi:MAG: beta-lactamase family protein [Acidobacteria bacterium]|nr:beta-lactamase family protein [Acidobacteriota bacterium]
MTRWLIISMKRTFVVLALTLLLPASSGLARTRSVQRETPSIIAAVDAIAQQALEERVPGLVIAVSLDGRFLFERAYGVQNLSTGTPVETDTIFQVASVTKQFTAAAIMKLVERDQLDLHADVRSILPEVETGDHTVTVEHLLTHTSGLPNYIEGTLDLHEPVTHAEMVAALNSKSMRFAPGTKWEYNNAGYYLLGMIIERLGGVGYPQFLEEELLHPLGLVETAYCGRPPAWPVPDGYLQFGSLAPVQFAAMDMSIPFAAGALCSTAEDLVRWARALEEGRILLPESYEAMTTNFELTTGQKVGYGYGLGVGSWNGQTIISHSGGIPGFSSFLMVAPESGLTVAVVANLLSTVRGVASEIGQDVAELFAERITGSN